MNRFLGQKKCIGILRETKNKWERRVPLTPDAVRELVGKGIRVLVQPSNKRIFKDQEYLAAGAELTDNLEPANCIFGVKEIPIKQLMPDKTYITFNHVIKAQPSNMPLLDAALKNRVRLFDYETIRATKENGGQRLVAFGRFAGLAGMIDCYRGMGERLLGLGYSTPYVGVASSFMYPTLDAAKRAVSEMGQEIARVGVPEDMGPMRFVFTGPEGNVGKGALEVFKLLPHEIVSPEQLATLDQRLKGKDRTHKVYATCITAKDMVDKISGDAFNKADYYANPQDYRPVFHEKIAPHMSALVNCMYWSPKFPRLLTLQQTKELFEQHPNQFLFDADITCDIQGSVEFLKRSSTIEEPFYLYNPRTGQISKNLEGDGIAVLGVDNLPTEFPLDASVAFSRQLRPFVEHLASSDHSVSWEEQGKNFPPEIRNACITADGQLTPQFSYLQKMRQTSERGHHSQFAKTADEVEYNLLLTGHLFDTGLINQTLDAIEQHAKDFQIVHWDVHPNREARASNHSSALVHVTSLSVEKQKALVDTLHNIMARTPSAQAEVHILPVGTYLDHNGERQDFPKQRNEAGEPASSKPAHQPSGKKVLVLGAGFVAGPLVEYLARVGHHSVTIASLLIEDAKQIAGDNPHTTAIALDASNQAAVDAQIKLHDVVVSLLPVARHPDVARTCIREGKHMVTASYVSPVMRDLHQAAVDAGVVIVNEVGLDPGIDHLSAMKVIDEVKAKGGQLLSFESVCGGLPAPEAADNPLGYKFSWSPLGVLLASQNGAVWKKDGQLKKIEPGSLLANSKPFEDLDSNAFSLEVLPNRDSLSYMPQYGVENADTFFRGTLRYKGFSAILDGLQKLGLFDKSERPRTVAQSWAHVMANLLNVQLPASGGDVKTLLEDAMRKHLKGQVSEDAITRTVKAAHWLGLTSTSRPVKISVDFPAPEGYFTVLHSFCELLKERLAYAEFERDLVIMFHKFGIKWKDGRKETRTSTLISFGGDGGPRSNIRRGGGGGQGWSAMARTVGLPAAIATDMVLTNRITRKGVVTPLTPDLYEPILEELKTFGIECKEQVVA